VNERQITFASHGHLLTNAGVWSRDGRRIVYDVRSNPDGSVFDGTRIETVDVQSGEVCVLYESKHGACCGVPTYSPTSDSIVFILGPERPTADWQYGFHRRQGVIVNEARPGEIIPLEARDISPPFTRGALRGGTHLHLFSPSGRLVSYTYHDLLVPTHADRRNIGVSVLGQTVHVPKSHERNHDGSGFSVIVTRTTPDPTPGSDEIRRASEEAWLGSAGRALAFQGEVITVNGRAISEVFIVDLPDDLAVAGDGPLEGSADGFPMPPRGTVQRRITFTQHGISGPRHWLRSSPDGSWIGFLMRDERSVVQFWTISPTAAKPQQITRARHGVESAFSWSPDGKSVAMVIDGCVGIVSVEDGTWRAIAGDSRFPLRPEACVFSPDGEQVVYMRVIDGFNQNFIARAQS
jgi:hypothetical protein